MDSKVLETSIAIKTLSPKLNRQEFELLEIKFKEGHVAFWLNLPVGIQLYTCKAPDQAYYILLARDKELLGYLLLGKRFLNTSPKLAGWIVLHAFLTPRVRKLGLMRRVYDAILSKGRLFASPVQTPKGVEMWVSRIKTDNRHLYVAYDGKVFLPIDASTVDQLKRFVWNGDPKTLLLCSPKRDKLIPKLLEKQAAKLKTKEL